LSSEYPIATIGFRDIGLQGSAELFGCGVNFRGKAFATEWAAVPAA
jgi:hypothetical protein